LSRTVVVGDSLTAGFQNFSLFHAPDSGQEFGYAALIAKQAGVKLTLPLIAQPGIPPRLMLNNAGQVVRAPGIGYRQNPLVQPFNLSVPGYLVSDAIEHPFPGQPLKNPIDAMADAVLGVPNFAAPGCGPIWNGKMFVVSEVKCAVALKPSFVIVSIGSNDALQALTLGLTPTDPQRFATGYDKLMSSLAGTNARMVVANIPDVTALPFLMPVPVFQSVCSGAQLPKGTKQTDFVVPNIVDATQTTLDLCTNFAVRPAALVAQAQAAVATFNQIIADKAKAVGAALIDFNTLFNGVATTGYCANSKLLTRIGNNPAGLGGLFTLDGIHPTNAGYAILANEAINTINAAYNTGIPQVSVDAIAATDPLVAPLSLQPCTP
jgi:lysophospholipase L1-like esterase